MTLTSELWGEQQCLEQGVKVAGAPLVFDAAQIASPTRRGRLARALCASAPGGRRGGPLVLLLLEKIPEHAEWNARFRFCATSSGTQRLLRVQSRESSAMLALLLSHLRLAEFSVDNRRADSEIRRLDGAEHCEFSRISVRLTGVVRVAIWPKCNH